MHAHGDVMQNIKDAHTDQQTENAKEDKVHGTCRVLESCRCVCTQCEHIRHERHPGCNSAHLRTRKPWLWHAQFSAAETHTETGACGCDTQSIQGTDQPTEGPALQSAVYNAERRFLLTVCHAEELQSSYAQWRARLPWERLTVPLGCV